MKSRFWLILTFVLISCLAPPAISAVPQTPPILDRLSVSSQGEEGDAASFAAGISANGQWVTFTSHASNLVPDDTNHVTDVFLHNRLTRQTRRISVASNGTEGNLASGDGSDSPLSANGRFVAFASSASNLVPNDTNNVRDIFVFDQQQSRTIRVSRASDGTQSNWPAQHPDISASGRFVIFQTAAPLVPEDLNGFLDVYLVDRDHDADGIFDEPDDHRTQLISLAADGSQANFGVSDDEITISATGRFIAFTSEATNLVANDTNGKRDIFIHDRDLDGDGLFDEPGTVTTVRVSVATDGTAANDHSSYADLSDDGRYIVFQSGASNLVLNEPSCQPLHCEDIFLHDRDSDEDGIFDEPGQILTTKVSVASDGTPGNSNSVTPAINGAGTMLAFASLADNLVPDDPTFSDVFIHELATGSTRRLSVTSAGGQADFHSYQPVIDADGNSVAFSSVASNLITGDTNNSQDLFVATLAGIEPVRPPGDGWQNQILDVYGQAGVAASLVLDQEQRPHIAYQSVAQLQGSLNYTFWDGVVWQTSSIDDAPENENYSAIALDRLEQPIIAYRGSTGGLKVARFQNGQWHVNSIDSSVFVGYQIAMVLHPDTNAAHILHINKQTDQLWHTYSDSFGWTSTLIAGNVPEFSRLGLAFDQNNVLHATYVDNLSQTIRYATWNGTQWDSQIADSQHLVGSHTSLAFNSQNQPQIAYLDRSNFQIRYGYRDGEGWHSQAVASVADGRQINIVSAPGDQVHISYIATGQLFLAQRQGDRFAVERLAEPVDQAVSLAIGTTSSPHLVYHDDTYWDLNYLTWDFDWQIRPVSQGPVDQHPALALVAGWPSLSYHDDAANPDRLLFSNWNGTEWAEETLLTNSNSPAITDLKYGNDGHPRLATISALDRTLTYRRWDGSQWHVEIVEAVSQGDLGQELTLLLDFDNKPSLIYTRQVGGQRHIRLAQWDGTAWQYSTHDLAPSLGALYEMDAAGSSADNIYVSYYEASDGDLRLAHWNGHDWHDELVDGDQGQDSGRFPAIALDVRLINDVLTEVVAIAYYDVSNQQVNFSFRSDIWHKTTAVSAAGPVTGLDMVLANESWLLPYIAYSRADDTRLRLTYSVDGLSSFQTDIVNESVLAVSAQLSLTTDNRPRLAFRGADGALRYAFPSSQYHVGIVPSHIRLPVGQLLSFDDESCISISSNRTERSRTAGNSLADGAVMATLTEIFRASAAGQQYIELYRRHVDELARITWSDPDLAWDVYRTLQNFLPGLGAFVSGRGQEAIIDQALVDQALALWQAIAEQASPELAAAINDQLAATNNLQDFAGGSFDHWALAIGIEPPSHQIYLPLVTVPAGE